MAATNSDSLTAALAAIDNAHSQDPNQQSTSGGSIPHELHYARKMTAYLEQHTSDPSPALQLAIRAQHLRRWEVPRSSYPATRAGYLTWRAGLKSRMSEQAASLCRQAGVDEGTCLRVGRLIKKEGLNKGEEEAQALEDIACLVFLDEQFEDFRREHNEEKIVNILRKTWGKMGDKGRQMALNMQMDDKSQELVKKALEGE
ncbi:MAG: hypothetical protein MMC23_003981 [Stictis urceolatum]|nr:hypothetical protein [Stictis urceolata]